MSWVTVKELIVAAGGDPRMGHNSTVIQDIVRWAHLGELRARASVCRLNGNEFRDADLPRDFWPDRAHHFLAACWSSGHFELHDALHCREAFGVLFAKEDAERLGLIPETKAATLSDRTGAADGNQQRRGDLGQWCKNRHAEGIGQEKAWKLIKAEQTEGKFTHVTRGRLRREYKKIDPNARPGPRSAA